MWQFTGAQRPDFALTPGPGQESVWDYPRPPQLVGCDRLVEVIGADGRPLASSRDSLRVLETASPPTYYLPPNSIDFSQLVAVAGSSYCEWKGQASYWALAGTAADQPVGWRYRKPKARFALLEDHVAFYPGRVECRVDSERVKAQPGLFYGGWITSGIVGPFKGEPGTGHW